MPPRSRIPLGHPGTGLIAFGAFAFSFSSSLRLPADRAADRGGAQRRVQLDHLHRGGPRGRAQHRRRRGGTGAIARRLFPGARTGHRHRPAGDAGQVSEAGLPGIGAQGHLGDRVRCRDQAGAGPRRRGQARLADCRGPGPAPARAALRRLLDLLGRRAASAPPRKCWCACAGTSPRPACWPEPWTGPLLRAGMPTMPAGCCSRTRSSATNTSWPSTR